MRKRYTEKERSELVKLVTTRRETVAEAAPRLGVALSTAYKWMRDRGLGEGQGRRRRPVGAPTFVRILSSREVNAGIAVRVGAAEIQIRRDFDADFLRAVVEALGGGDA